MTVKEALRVLQPLRGFPKPIWDIPGNNSFSQDLGEGWSLRVDFADAAAGGLLTAATLRPPVQQQHQPAAYEVILIDDRIRFDSGKDLQLQLLARNVGDQALDSAEILTGLSLRLDGKDYRYGPRGFSILRRPEKIEPLATWKVPFQVKEFGLAADALDAGRHTISVKGAAAESNTITMIVGAEGSAPAAAPARLPENENQAAAVTEIILDPARVAFESAANVTSTLLVRNVGDAKLQAAPEWYWGLVLVWDGKEYERDPQHKTAWNGPAEILPRSAWRSGISLSEYRVPAERLSDGRHTMGLRSGKTNSNVVSITIGKAK
jgi:archaellum component FlaG (FlaF/FlaG flagellin family)